MNDFKLLEESTIILSLPNWLLISVISIMVILQLISLCLGFKKAKIARDRLNESNRARAAREKMIEKETAKIMNRRG